MLSLPVAVQLRPTGASSIPQPATASAQKGVQQAFGSAPALSFAPEWNGGSFRVFSEILSARLKETTASSSSDTTDTEEAKSDAPAASPSQPVQSSLQYKPALSQPQVDQSSALPEESPREVSSLSVAVSQTFQMPAPLKNPRSGTMGDTPGSPSQLKSPGTSSAKDQPIPAAQLPREASIASATNISTPIIVQPEEAEPGTIRTGSVGTPQLQRPAALQISSARAQDPTVAPQQVSGKTDADVQAFQIDLHAGSELTKGSDSEAGGPRLQVNENVSNLGTKTSAATQAPDVSQPGRTNTSSDQSAGDKRSPAAASIQPKTQIPVEQGQPATATQAFSTGSGNQNAASGAPAQPAAVPGQFSLASTRNMDPNSAPMTSPRSAQANLPIEATRPLAPNQMTVRMEGASGQVINVRFVNQGDQVQVAVRSNDPATSAQLRQGLTSLTDDLSRIGWKADLSAASTHATTATLHDAARPETDSQGNNKGSGLDWEQDTPKKKSPGPELWEELKDLQEA